MEDSGIFVPALFLDSLKRFRTRPSEIVRRLLIKLIGEETLKQSVACGSQDGKARKRGKQGKPGIDPNIKKAIFGKYQIIIVFGYSKT